MNLIDYTSKLNNHSEYIQILKQLSSKCKYIEYVIVNEEELDFINDFKDNIMSVQLKNKWWGTKSSRKSKVYTIKADEGIFNYLRRLETFCKYTVNDNGDIVENTEFGINDIAFFDDNEIPLLFTTTHEGYIYVRSDLNK